MTPATWQTIIGLIGALVLAVLGWIVNSIVDLKADMKATKVQMSLVPLAAMIQSQLLNKLHHDGAGFEEPDALIDQWRNGTITEPGKNKLKAFFAQRVISPDVSETERLNANAALAIMAVVKFEEESIRNKLSTKVLSVILGLSIASIRALHNFR